MTSIFSKIVQGNIPCHTIWEDEEHLAFLDIQPFADGHTLVIPKLETDYIFDLSTARAEALWSTAHKVAQLLKQKVTCERVAVLVLGYEVPHAHIHLIPTQSESQILQPKRQVTDHPKLAKLAAHIRGDVDNTQISKADLTTQEVQEKWNNFADRFVSQAEHTTVRIAKAAIEYLKIEDAHNILEIGCGGGKAGLELFSRLQAIKSKAQLTLSDLSTEMLRIAHTLFQSQQVNDDLVRIEQADAQNLPYNDSSFDRILSCLNLMLVPDPHAAIKEAARVLKEDGIGVWVVWGRPEYSHMMTLTSLACKQLDISLSPPNRSNFHLGGRDTLRSLFLKYGFSSVRRWYQPMISHVTTGKDFVSMVTNLRPELKELTGEQYLKFQEVLGQRAQTILDQGEVIGLDALILVAKK